MDDDPRWMRRALGLAARGLGRTSPNPVVGAVVVRDGALVGEGWHRRAGEPHGEAVALERAGEAARGATLYVTLEPCVHRGRTPPCVDAVLASGVTRVVFGSRDPDPRVDGRGAALLREAGLAVTEGIAADEARAQNRPFFKHVRSGLPWVLLKLGLSLDGRVAAPGRRYLTGDTARKHVHRLRDEHDAVMVGVGTVLADDPLLTVRDVRGRDPLRVVVDSDARTPPTARVIARDGRAVIAVGEGAQPARVAALREAGAQVVTLPRAARLVDLRALARWLDQRDALSILLEGGPTLAAAALVAGIVDQVLFIYAPVLIGEGPPPALADAIPELRLRDARAYRLGEDLAVEGFVPPD